MTGDVLFQDVFVDENSSQGELIKDGQGLPIAIVLPGAFGFSNVIDDRDHAWNEQLFQLRKQSQKGVQNFLMGLMDRPR